jgi:hypothetical protein
MAGSWEMALNLLTLSLITFNLVATYALARWLTGRHDTAVISAVAFGLNGYVMAHYGHLNLQILGLVSLSFLLLFRQLEAPRLATAPVLGVCLAALFMTAVYYAVVWAISALVVVVYFAAAGAVDRRRVAALMLAGALAMGLSAPVAVQYIHLQHSAEFRRGLAPTAGLRPFDVFSPASGSWLYGARSPRRPNPDEHRFFPGVLIGLLAIVGLANSWRRDSGEFNAPEPDRRRQRYRRALVTAAAVTLVLALGDTVNGVPAPFRILARHVPGLAAVRIPARFAVIALLAGSVLAAVGFDHLATRRAWSRYRRLTYAGLVVAVTLLEFANRIPHSAFDDSRATLAVYRQLAREGPGVVLELPIRDPRKAIGVYTEAPRMAYATVDWHPRVNGSSAFIPRAYIRDRRVLNSFPSPQALTRAHELHVRYVLLHVGSRNGFPMFEEASAQAVIDGLPTGSVVHRYGSSWLVRLPIEETPTMRGKEILRPLSADSIARTMSTGVESGNEAGRWSWSVAVRRPEESVRWWWPKQVKLVSLPMRSIKIIDASFPTSS